MGLKDRIPSVLPIFREDSDLGTVVDAIESEFDEISTDTSSVQDSFFVETAEGQSLDLIGEELSIIARRRGRDDAQYRQFLQGLVPAFDGRGTERDVEVAVAAAVTFDADSVDLVQDFGNREYQVELLNSDWIAHSSATTRELAAIADPVAVDRVDPVILFTEEVAVRFALGDATAETAAIGLSSSELKPLSTDGFILSIRQKPAAGVAVDAGSIVVRPMTDSQSVTVTVNASGTGIRTVAGGGLSSVQLGELSTTAHEPLSA